MFAGEPEGPKLTAEGLPDFASYEDVYVADALAYTVTGPANVRAFPTSQGTEALYSLSPGSFVTAREVKAFDPSSKWLQLADGQYVWARNLEPLEVTKAGDTAMLPDFLHGTWSSMDTCRGFDTDQEIEIGPRTIKNYGAPATLASISADDRGKPIYNFGLDSEQSKWFGSFVIMIDEISGALSIDIVGHQDEEFTPFYRPDTDCASVIRY
jgi:hypothetical protein